MHLPPHPNHRLGKPCFCAKQHDSGAVNCTGRPELGGRPGAANYSKQETWPMSGFVQALRAYRDGTLTREKLLTEGERHRTYRETHAVTLLKLLNEEHSRTRLPDNLHGVIAARILQFRDPPSPF